MIIDKQADTVQQFQQRDQEQHVILNDLRSQNAQREAQFAKEKEHLELQFQQQLTKIQNAQQETPLYKQIIHADEEFTTKWSEAHEARQAEWFKEKAIMQEQFEKSQKNLEATQAKLDVIRTKSASNAGPVECDMEEKARENAKLQAQLDQLLQEKSDMQNHMNNMSLTRSDSVPKRVARGMGSPRHARNRRRRTREGPELACVLSPRLRGWHMQGGSHE